MPLVIVLVVASSIGVLPSSPSMETSSGTSAIDGSKFPITLLLQMAMATWKTVNQN